METDRAAAIAEIDRLAHSVAGLDEAALGSSARVRVMIAGDGTEAELGTTVARELAFAAHHAVHHHAMIKAIAAECGADCPDDFGKAPSTIEFERRST